MPVIGPSVRGTTTPWPPRSTAAPPSSRRPPSPPLFHRLKVRDFEVTALLDGAMQMLSAFVPRFFPDSTPE